MDFGEDTVILVGIIDADLAILPKRQLQTTTGCEAVDVVVEAAANAQ